jgi:copper(I)-binding protein
MLVRDAWLRVPIGGITAGYLVIENQTGQDDKLVAVTLPGGGSAMLHQTVTDSSGLTGMAMLEAIPVPAGATVALQAGGFHLMIDGVPPTIDAGKKVELELRFEHAGLVVVQADVRQG